MAKGTLLFVALVALIVGALIGLLLRPKPEPVKQKAGGHIIRVDKDGKVNKEEVELNRDDHDVAFWVEDDRSKNLFIEFKTDQPFEGMTETDTPDGKRWLVHCVDYTCFSGEIRNDAEGGGKKYQYWQRVKNKDGSGGTEVDGWIVIRP
jgi:hypothetical protein